jgi:hypothetical protein
VAKIIQQIIQKMVRVQGCFDEPNGHGLCRQAPKGLLAELQHLAVEIRSGGEFLIGIGDFFAIQPSSTPFDLATRFAAAGANANGTH